MRPLCNQCKTNLKAVNYHLNGKVYYRKLCEACRRKKINKKPATTPRWYLAGYRLKKLCEKCGFDPTTQGQLVVFHIDKNQESVNIKNLKTVCLNCNYELSITGWLHGDLLEDH